MEASKEIKISTKGNLTKYYEQLVSERDRKVAALRLNPDDVNILVHTNNSFRVPVAKVIDCDEKYMTIEIIQKDFTAPVEHPEQFVIIPWLVPTGVPRTSIMGGPGQKCNGFLIGPRVR